MARCVIVSGAPIGDYSRIRRYLRPDDFFVFCDGGLRHRAGLQAEADLIVGDFDSHEKPAGGAEIIALPREKDDTDTYAAIKYGFERGGRMDHTIGNLSLLHWLDKQGKTAMLADDWSDIRPVSRNRVLIPDSVKYFSLLNICGTARGIDITGAKYPLNGGEIRTDWQYGISNEVIPGETASVSVQEGSLLLMQIYRDPQTEENRKRGKDPV